MTNKFGLVELVQQVEEVKSCKGAFRRAEKSLCWLVIVVICSAAVELPSKNKNLVCALALESRRRQYSSRRILHDN